MTKLASALGLSHSEAPFHWQIHRWKKRTRVCSSLLILREKVQVQRFIGYRWQEQFKRNFSVWKNCLSIFESYLTVGLIVKQTLEPLEMHCPKSCWRVHACDQCPSLNLPLSFHRDQPFPSLSLFNEHRGQETSGDHPAGKRGGLL